MSQDPDLTLSRRAPVQRATIRDRDGTITWQEHCEVWEAYSRAHPGNKQDAECIARRHGFGKAEAEQLLGRPLQTWEAR